MFRILSFLLFLTLSATLKAQQYKVTGWACMYSKSLCDGKVATGKRLDCEALTAAHRTLPIGTQLRVTNLRTQNSVIVTINDRGPYSKKFVIDLTPRAAKAIDLDYRKGTVKVLIEQLVW
jgi:rare lipoprotein A